MNHDEFFNNQPDWRPYADLVVYPPTADEVRAEFADAEGSDILKREGAICTMGITRLALYVRIRREGNDHRFAEMLALQRPARGNTTDTFWAGRKPFWEIYGEKYANEIRGLLKRQGVTLKPGDEYMPELARHRGDKEAVVPFGGARGYIKSLCERRGWAVEGGVKANHRQPESDPLDYDNCVALAPDLIESNARQLVNDNPKLKRMDRRELREKVLAEHGPPKGD